jgi:hypothetical protein
MARLRKLLIASVLALPLCGCSTYDAINDSLDPSDWFSGDFFGLGAKKKLQGERKDVFPEGVPGVAKGVPPELVKGNQAAAGTEQQATIIQDEEPKPPPKPKAKAKPKPKADAVVRVERAPTSITVRRPAEAQQDQQPSQQQTQSQPPRGAAQWPDPPGARTAAQPQGGPATGGVQWPDPPPMR